MKNPFARITNTVQDLRLTVPQIDHSKDSPLTIASTISAYRVELGSKALVQLATGQPGAARSILFGAATDMEGNVAFGIDYLSKLFPQLEGHSSTETGKTIDVICDGLFGLAVYSGLLIGPRVNPLAKVGAGVLAGKEIHKAYNLYGRARQYKAACGVSMPHESVNRQGKIGMAEMFIAMLAGSASSDIRAAHHPHAREISRVLGAASLGMSVLSLRDGLKSQNEYQLSLEEKIYTHTGRHVTPPVSEDGALSDQALEAIHSAFTLP